MKWFNPTKCLLWGSLGVAVLALPNCSAPPQDAAEDVGAQQDSAVPPPPDVDGDCVPPDCRPEH